ncbi:LysR substrate-binding domain-containing protein [Nonomuraea sp. 3-1Str]|uniref:LysR family transcriptional regulator n=2 Tax=unclassified Nonomuraea TaxID=2593643 RepID=UPI00285B5418|nr:LysR substrate-binding domain-containing protein [Nonomuraea sp. 3-1Str]MDR8415252.1 LysR substrate-binding domain-containing protein [Nonomuraea sp. 3-1Str]
MRGIMDLLSLRYFQAVARHEHISRAAEELRVAQPSLSRTIARLESDLGVPLFDRHGRRIRLNRFGAAFLRRVNRALAELDDARRELADAAGLARGSVSLASETLLTVTEPVKSFIAEHPGIAVRLFQANPEVMTERLSEGQVDFCLASEVLDGPGLVHEELLREEILLAVPLGHRLAGRREVTMADLAGEPVVTTRPGIWQRTLAERLFSEAGLELVVACEIDEATTAIEMVSAGLGVGFGPAWYLRSPLAASRAPFSPVPLAAPGAERVLWLVWREGAYVSEAARRFRDHLTASLITT